MPAGTVAVIGAGSVGASIAFTILQRGLARRVLLNDVNLDKARGEALDLEHCTALVPAVEIQAAALPELAGSDVIIITAGAKQHPGQTRLDLAETNVGIFRKLIPELRRHAPEAWIIVVSNPVDVLTYAALRLSGAPPSRIVGSGTVLDTARLRNLIARRIRISPANVHAYILGEHGDSEIASWSTADVGGLPLEHVPHDGRDGLPAAERAELLDETRLAASRVIAAKGATNWAVAVATARILEAYIRDEQALLTVSRHVEDFHGVRDVCFSLPSVISAAGVGPALPLRLNDDERAGLRASALAIRKVLERVGLA